MRNIKIHFCISNEEANALKLALYFTQGTDKSPKIYLSISYAQNSSTEAELQNENIKGSNS